MSKIVAVVNQKGGVGKTTTTVNLATALSSVGKKILIIDFDPQGNATTGLGVTDKKIIKGSYEVLIRTVKSEEASYETIIPNLFLMPSSTNLSGAEVELVNFRDRERQLKESIQNLKSFFDYIFIDCPPSLGLLTLNALVAADQVLVPLQCEFYALEGLSQLLHTISMVKKNMNPSLDLQGIILTMFDSRSSLSTQVEKDVRHHLKNKVYKTMIPRNVRVAEAPSFGKPAILYDMRCLGSQAYIQLAKEILIQEKGASRMNEMRKQVLGRGLSALLAGTEENSEDLTEMPLPIEKILAGRNQPRQYFGEDELASLAFSIQQKGVLQPILIRKHPEIPNMYEIVAGERRWRASKIAGLSHIPVLIREFTDAQVLEVGLLENIQREDLNPIEEAKGYHRLAADFHYTQDQLSRSLGKSRSHITNTLRLLTLPDSVQDALIHGKLSAGHGRALVGLEYAEALAEKIVEKGLSVREVEALTKEKKSSSEKSPFSKTIDPEQDILQQHLCDLLGTSVDLIFKGKSGKIVIHFGDLEELDLLIQKLNKP